MATDNETLNRFVIGIQIQGGDQINKLLNSVKQINGVMQKSAKTMGGVSGATKQQAAAMSTIGQIYDSTKIKVNAFDKTMIRSFRSQKNEMADVIRRVTLWSSALTVLFGSINKIREVYKATLDIQVAMAELHKVMGDTAPYERIKKEIFSLSKAFSVSQQSAFDIAKIWAQQGKTPEEVIKLTNIALRGMNSANLTAAQSVEFLTSVTKTYNMEASRTYSVLDGIMKVQASYAITAQNLAKGFLVAGKAASLMGDDLGTVMGMITAIGEVTRETGNKIGTSLKTQLARLASPETLAFLQKRGIETRGPNGILNARTIYSQLYNKIQSGEINKDMEADIARKIGGKRKYKDVIVLMDRFNVAEEARMKFLKAQNDAMKASNILQETLTKKFQKLDTILTQIGDNVLSRSLLPALGIFADVAIKIGDSLSNISSSKIGDLTLAAMMFAGIRKIGSMAGNKFMQGRMTSAIQEMELTAALRSKGMFSGTNRYEKMFGLVTPTFSSVKSGSIPSFIYTSKFAKANQTMAKETTRLTSAYSKYLQNIETLTREANKLGMDANVVRRSLFTNVMLSGQNVPTGKLAPTKMFFKSFFTSLKKTEKMADNTGAAMYKMAIAGETLGMAIKGIGKTIAIIAAVEVAIWGIEKLVSYIMDKTKDHSIKLSSVIKPTSDASNALKSLAESMKLIQDKAVKADMSTKEYVDKMDFYDIYSLLNDRVIKPLAKDLQKGGKIKTLEDLQMAFQKLGITVKDTTDAVDKQMIIYRFIGSELLKQKNQIVDAWSKISQDVIKDLVKKFNNSGIQAIRGAGGTAYLASSDIKNILNTIAKTNIFQNGKSNFETPYIDYNKLMKVINGGNIGNEANEFLKNVYYKSTAKNGMKLGDLIESAYKAGGVAQKTMEKYLYDKFIEGLQKKKPVGNINADVFKKTKGQSDKDFVTNVMTQLAPDFINKAATQIIMKSSLAKYIKLEEIFGKKLPNAINYSADALMAYIAGLLKAKDRLFAAMNDYLASLQKIEYQRKLFGITGIKKSTAEENLNAYRKFIFDISNIPITLEKQKRSIMNQYERAFTLIKKDKFLPENIKSNIVKELKDMNDPERGMVIIENWLDQLKQNNENSPLTKNLRKIVQSMGDTLASIAIENGSIITGLKTMFDLAHRLKNKTGIDYGEKTIRDAEALAAGGDFGGAYKKLKSNKKLYRKLESEYIKSILDINMPKIEAEFKVKKKEIAFKFRKLFNFDTVFNFTKQEGLTKIQNVIDKYNELIRQKNDLLIKDANADQAKIKAEIAELERKKQLSVEIEKQNYLYSLYEIQINKIREALDSFRTSTINFLSDVNSFDVTKQSGFNQSVKNYLNNISGTVLNASMSEFWDSVVGKKGGGLAAFLLGEKLPKTPQEIALDNNTKSIDTLTSAIVGLSNIMLGKSTSTISGFNFNFNGKKYTNGIGIHPNNGNNISPFAIGGKYWHPSTGNNININDSDFKRDKSFYIARALGQMGGMLSGNLVAKGMHRNNEFVGIGSTLFSAIAGSNPIIQVVMSLLGGTLGGLFGSRIKDKNKTDDKLDKLNDKAKKIIENTEPLKAVDSRIINAPANFILPPIARSGGNIQNINITINGAGSPNETARAVKKIFEDNYNFNNVSNNI